MAIDSTNPCIVLVTAPDEAIAKKLARSILDKKLAACVNIVPGLHSMFWWQGKIDEQHEVLLIMKTFQVKLNDLIAEVKKEHPYDIPEILALPIIGGSEEYLQWLRDGVRP
ncbi:divalent-cation tolerance protein CutA [bacterium]|nr:divalent-cation tolerance protein CutA [bacterium]